MTVQFEEYTVGVLALQGAFREHLDLFKKATIKGYPENVKFSFIEVRTNDQLDQCDALVVPGGESTSMSLIAERTHMLEPLAHFLNLNKPVWGTCAGLIFLAKQIINGKPEQKLLGGLDIQVKRNAFGRQMNSFESCLNFSAFIPGVDAFPTIFIRAPVISKILKTDFNDELVPIKEIHNDVDNSSINYSSNKFVNNAPVEVLQKLDSGLIVAVRQGKILGTSFHPELSDDYRFHKWFIDQFLLKQS